MISGQSGGNSMNEDTLSRNNAVATVIGVVVTLEAAVYLLAASLHLGVRIPLGFATLSEPGILPAAVVEGLSGIFLATSGYALFTRKGWAGAVAVAAHVFSILGVLLGMYALAVGAGPSSELNEGFHRVILPVLVLVLVVLLTPLGRAALGRYTSTPRRG